MDPAFGVMRAIAPYPALLIFNEHSALNLCDMITKRGDFLSGKKSGEEMRYSLLQAMTRNHSTGENRL